MKSKGQKSHGQPATTFFLQNDRTMKKAVLLSALIITIHQAVSQEILYSDDFQIDLKKSERRESYPIISKEDQSIAIFLLGEGTVRGMLFDSSYNLLSSTATQNVEKSYDILLGSSVQERIYHLYFANNKKQKFYAKTIDFATGEESDKLQSLSLKKERFLESFQYNNKLILLTIKKFSSILVFYVFEGNEMLSRHEVDFEEKHFNRIWNKTLYEVLNEADGRMANKTDIHKIDNESPNSLELTFRKDKLYYRDGILKITLDNSTSFTKMLVIDLNDFSFAIKHYNQGIIDTGGTYAAVKSNSFLSWDKLFQVKSSKQELYLSVLDLKTETLQKEYRIYDEEDLTIANTPVIQEGGNTVYVANAERELDKTNKILRKIASSDIAVSAYRLPGFLEVSIGGIKEVVPNGGGGMSMMPGTSISTPYGMVNTPPTYHFNPTMNGYNGYYISRSVQFTSLLDKNTYEHVEGEIPENAFDKIHDFIESFRGAIEIKTIFKVDDAYILAYYGVKGRYFLRQFTD